MSKSGKPLEFWDLFELASPTYKKGSFDFFFNLLISISLVKKKPEVNNNQNVRVYYFQVVDIQVASYYTIFCSFYS